MNEEKNQIIFKNFLTTMAWLEKYIDKSNYYSDWEERKQTHTIEVGPGINEANEIRGRFLTCLMCFETILGCNQNFNKETPKTKFFQWISAVKIGVDNCPTDLSLLLYYFHEVLEGRGEKLCEQVQEDADRSISKMSKEEREKGWNKFTSILKQELQKKRIIENPEFNPHGQAEEGQKTFQKLIGNINNYNLFPENETNPDDNSLEAQAAIKELEKLLEEKWTIDEEEPNQNPLKSLEKTIQDLEAFESNTTANGGKNNYAWKKLRAGAKLIDLKSKQVLLGGETPAPLDKNNKKRYSNLDNSTLYLSIAAISIIFIFFLGMVIYLEKAKKKKKQRSRRQET